MRHLTNREGWLVTATCVAAMLYSTATHINGAETRRFEREHIMAENYVRGTVNRLLAQAYAEALQACVEGRIVVTPDGASREPQAEFPREPKSNLTNI